MKSKVNQVFEVLKSNETKAEKTRKLIGLGIGESELQELFSIYETEDDVLYTIGVEIECYGLDKAKFAELCRVNNVDLQAEGYNHDTKPYFKIVKDASIVGENAIECVTPVIEKQGRVRQFRKGLQRPIDDIPAGIIDKKFKKYYNKRAAELDGVARNNH